MLRDDQKSWRSKEHRPECCPRDVPHHGRCHCRRIGLLDRHQPVHQAARQVAAEDAVGKVARPEPRRRALAVVDKVKTLVGGTCTIFQRMNDAGDMLRVCTNVKKDGTRAIGTYIPAVNPDGKPNPVIAALLRGETYVGRAFVVDDWYIAAYEPIYDAEKQVSARLYVGVKQEDVADLRKGIMDIVAGKTGYVYVLGGSGEQKGRTSSRKGQRDGENIWDAKDANGTSSSSRSIDKALATKNGECDFERYPWQNQGETEAR